MHEARRKLLLQWVANHFPANNDAPVGFSSEPDVNHHVTFSAPPSIRVDQSTTSCDLNSCDGIMNFIEEQNVREITLPAGDLYDDNNASRTAYDVTEEVEALSVSNMPSEGRRETEKKALKRLCLPYFTELHGIFTRGGTSIRTQDELMHFFRNLPDEVRDKLPKSGKTLRPPAIRFTRRLMPPGEFTYFGIENTLNYAGDVLFDKNSNEIKLACNMDGVPLSRTASGKHFWPILGNIEEYPVFVIAAYEGTGQPICANEYIRDFVDEVKYLTLNGCKVNGRIYKFRLRCLICDSPATCFIIGCKYHGAIVACRRCKAIGKRVPLVGVNVKGEQKSAIRYPTISDELRTHEEFVEFAQITEDPHKKPSVPGNVDGQERHIERNYQHKTKFVFMESKEGFFAVHENNDVISDSLDFHDVSTSTMPTGMETGKPVKRGRGTQGGGCGRRGGRGNGYGQRGRGRGGKRVSKKMEFLTHPSILTEIPGFDIVRDVILDSMHILGGLMKTMIERWMGRSLSDRTKFKLSSDALKLISDRLVNASNYCPQEFQRHPESLEHLASWKNTQLRQFLLYVGPIVLLGAVSDTQLQHFHLLVIAIRLMCRRLPDDPEVRVKTVKFISNICRNLLRIFLEEGNEIYGENFSLYNAHHTFHIPDDYEYHCLTLDALSAYRYENANGHVKCLITGHFRPLTQLQNKVSSLVHTKMYGRKEKNKVINTVEEYYEIPELCHPIADNFDGMDLLFASNEEYEERFDSYQEMRFRNFKLRTDNEKDCHVLISGPEKSHFVRLKKILQDCNTDEIFLVGYEFERRRPLFSLKDYAPYTSLFAGIGVCDELSTCLRIFPFNQLSEKCFGLPLDLLAPDSNGAQWVLSRFLH